MSPDKFDVKSVIGEIKKNLIMMLKHEDNWIEGTNTLKPIVLQYFSVLFTSAIQGVDPEVLNKVFPKGYPTYERQSACPIFY
jgi:hypothetical protein